MALNQTQRDHAIKMISERIAEKRKTIKIEYPDAKKFIADEMAMISPTKNILKRIADNTSANNNYYRNNYPSLGHVDLCNIFPDMQARWDDTCKNTDDMNKLLLKELNQLEETLIGEVMFGTSYAIIEAAFAKIEAI